MPPLEPLDYKKKQLYINGILVNCLVLVGKLIELMFTISRRKGINFGGLLETDLPDTVALTLDNRGEQQVRCFDADRALAVRLGKVIRLKLSNNHLEVVSACVPVKNPGGKRVGEHDLICEVVGGRGFEQLRQYLSVELKIRMLYSDNGRAKVRREQRKELCTQCTWWQAERDNYCGRLILLGCFEAQPRDRNEATEYKLNTFQLYGDLMMRDDTKFRGVVGWEDASSSIQWALPKQASVSQSAPKRALSAPAPRPASAAASRSASAAAPSSSQPMSVKAMIEKVDQLSFPGGFCEVKFFLTAVERNPSKASYWSKKAIRRHDWTAVDVVQRPRSLTTSGGGRGRKRAGGKDEWMASKRVLKQMCRDFRDL